ncbi:hypothetical protein MIR68_000802 [Amoeboaphelidium protococcarum]|nr:hypothetical protein MIR68_000802 [Amoeboaphelidium protococcarum]
MANVERAVELIHKATKGFGCDDQKLIDVFLSLNKEELVQVDKRYKANYGKSVFEVIGSETGGNFSKLLSMCLTSEAVFTARKIEKAISGILTTDHELLRELLLGRTNAEIMAIRDAYKALFNRELEDKLVNEYSGDMKKLFCALIQAGRDETGELHKDVNADVQTIYSAGEGRFGTDEVEFIRILATRSYPQLRQVFTTYAAKHGHTMEKAIKKEFSGKIEKALLDLVRVVNNRAKYFAEEFEEAFQGTLGINEGKLHRLLIRFRKNALLHDINAAYMEKTGDSLERKIKKVTSGDHEKLCVALLKDGNVINPEFHAQEKKASSTASAPPADIVPAQAPAPQAQPSQQQAHNGYPGNAQPQQAPVQQPQPQAFNPYQAQQQPPYYGQPQPQQQPYYPPQQPQYGYAPQPGYPPQQQYAPAQQPYYPPPQQQGYPPQQQYGGPPPQQQQNPMAAGLAGGALGLMAGFLAGAGADLVQQRRN